MSDTKNTKSWELFTKDAQTQVAPVLVHSIRKALPLTVRMPRS
jgi:hypothetical protein